MPKIAMLLLFALAAAACAAGPAEEAASPAGPAGSAETVAVNASSAAIEALEIRNARLPAPNLLTGGQLSEGQMSALREMGYGTFINLRPADESGTGWEEKYAAAEGIEFVRIPVRGVPDVTRETAQRLADVMAAAGAEPVVVYCASGNRVGGLLALKAFYLDGKSAEDSLEFGKAAGVTRLEPKIREMLGLAEPGS